MDRLAPFVSGPGGLRIPMAGRSDYGCIHQRAFLDGDRLGFQLACDLIEQDLVEPAPHQFPPEPYEGGALRCGLVSSKTTEVPKRGAVL